MSGIGSIVLICDFNVKDVKSHTLVQALQQCCIRIMDIEKSDGTIMEVLFNTVLSFQTMSLRMNFTGTMMFSYFNKCLMDNTLEEWRSVTPHEDDQTVETFKYSIEEWFSTLLPDNAFLIQKEWMTNTMKKPFVMRVKDFENRLKTLN